MIIVIRGKDYKRLAIKLSSYIALIIMFYFYYGHMASKFQEQSTGLEKKAEENVQALEKESKVFKEAQIEKEAQKIKELLSNGSILKMEVIKDRLLLVVSSETDIEPVMIRYGASAFVKNTSSETKIAIPLSMIVKEDK